MEEYLCLVQACKILSAAKKEVSDEDGDYGSPVWAKIKRIINYLDDQAEAALRGPDEHFEMEEMLKNLPVKL